MAVTLRPAVPDDAEVCGRICFEAFNAIAAQHGYPPDFGDPEMAIGALRGALRSSHVHAIVAEHDGRVVGSNFMAREGLIGGIGPITVDPSEQDVSVGRELMEAMLELARELGLASVRLVQTAYHTRSLSLYAKLGFDARESLAVLQGSPPPAPRRNGPRVRPVVGADVDGCNLLCAEVHGHDRSGELGRAQAARTALLVEREGELCGYTSGVGFVGHSVARSNEDLMALIAASPSYLGAGFLVPLRNGELLRWCLNHGLRVQQVMTLMSLGFYNEPQGAWLPSVAF